jgi:hypothetical protein
MNTTILNEETVGYLVGTEGVFWFTQEKAIERAEALVEEAMAQPYVTDAEVPINKVVTYAIVRK